MTRVMTIEPDSEAAMSAIYAELEARARHDLARLGVPGTPHWHRAGDMRYRGQGYEIRAELPAGPIGQRFAERVIEAFHAGSWNALAVDPAATNR